MTYRSILLAVVVGWLVALGPGSIPTHSAQAQPPVVYAVLFYSPSCEHCHQVITEVLPPLQERFGDQLKIVYIDTTQASGNSMFYVMCDIFDINDSRCGYVPTMVIGSTVLVGGTDIPKYAATLIQEGLDAGGLELPPVPGLQRAYEASLAAAASSDDSAPATTPPTLQTDTWQDKLVRDKLGNSFALTVLGLLIAGLVVQLGQGARLFGAARQRQWTRGRAGWLFVLLLAVMTTVIAATLVLEETGISLPTVLAVGVTLGMAVIVWAILQQENRGSRRAGYSIPGWVLPLASCLGLVVAAYLAYIELGEHEAVCGTVGDCNTVQQSEYAKLFGVLPIGVLGMIGYVLILAAWVTSLGASGSRANMAQAALLGLALFGTGFSIYLTFLEPFVIGASCAWCLTSAMLMILILGLQAPTGWAALNRLIRPAN